jgi:DNA-directed RNA polymerase specialized sigma24 family protein
MRRQARRESSRAWIASGAPVTIKAYARRYGVDRYTAYEDLAAIGFPLPDSAQRWAHRPPPQQARTETPEERTARLRAQVWKLYDQGMRVERISATLGIPVDTVERYPGKR